MQLLRSRRFMVNVLWRSAWMLALSLPASAAAGKDAPNEAGGHETLQDAPDLVWQREWRFPFRRTDSFRIPATSNVRVENGAGPLRIALDPPGADWSDATAMPMRLSGETQAFVAEQFASLAAAMRAQSGCSPNPLAAGECRADTAIGKNIERIAMSLERLCQPSCGPDLVAVRGEIEALRARVKMLEEEDGSGPDDGTRGLAQVLRQVSDHLMVLTRTLVPDEVPGSEFPLADACDNLQEVFPFAERIVFSVALVPDRRVPRHRRAYDLSLQAIGSGMRANGYVLDRFDLPWSGRSNPSPDDASTQSVQADGAFGLLVFRDDLWRSEDCKVVDTANTGDCRESIRAVYVVPERATLGVLPQSFNEAWYRILLQMDHGAAMRHARDSDMPVGTTCAEKQIHRAETATAFRRDHPDDHPVVVGQRSVPRVLLQEAAHGLCEGGQDAARTLLVLGPNFSGSVGSLRRLWQARENGWGLCLVSASATVASNERSLIERPAPTSIDVAADASRSAVRAPSRTFEVHTLAQSDTTKLQALHAILERNGVDSQQVAFLLESSTFGNAICPESEKGKGIAELCDKALRISFPANIADVRYGRAQQREQRRRDGGDSTLEPLRLSQNLRIEEGAENGSEYPESEQSPLTSNGAELAIENAIGELRRRRVRAVVVAATEVRDRLFLFDVLRRDLPDALFVDLEADALLAHPDVVHATRGTLLLASAPLTVRSCRDEKTGVERRCGTEQEQENTVAVHQTDRQALLHEVVCASGREGAMPCQLSGPGALDLQVVGRKGLLRSLGVVPLSRSDGAKPRSLPDRIVAVLVDGRLWFWLAMALWLILAAFEVLHPARYRDDTRPWTRYWLRRGCEVMVIALALLVLWATEGVATTIQLAGTAACLLLVYAIRRLGEHTRSSLAPYGFGDAQHPVVSAGWMASVMAIVVCLAGVWLCVSQLRALVPGVVSIPTLSPAQLLDAGSGLAIGVAVPMLAAGLVLLVGWFRVGERERRADGQRLIVAIDREPARELRAEVEQHRPEYGISFRWMPALLVLPFLGVQQKPGLFGASASATVLVAAVLALILGTHCLFAAWREFALGRTITRALDANRAAAAQDMQGFSDAVLGALKGLLAPAPTPIASNLSSLGDLCDLVANPADWTTRLRACLFRAERSNACLGAVVFLIARAVTRLRLFVLLAMGCGLLVVLLAYLTPFTCQDSAVLASLVLLSATAVLGGMAAHGLEHDTVLRLLLSQRQAPATWSRWIFGMVAIPIVALGVALAVLQNPGVLQGADGIFDYLLSRWHGNAVT